MAGRSPPPPPWHPRRSRPRAAHPGRWRRSRRAGPVRRGLPAGRTSRWTAGARPAHREHPSRRAGWRPPRDRSPGPRIRAHASPPAPREASAGGSRDRGRGAHPGSGRAGTGARARARSWPGCVHQSSSSSRSVSSCSATTASSAVSPPSRRSSFHTWTSVAAASTAARRRLASPSRRSSAGREDRRDPALVERAALRRDGGQGGRPGLLREHPQHALARCARSAPRDPRWPGGDRPRPPPDRAPRRHAPTRARRPRPSAHPVRRSGGCTVCTVTPAWAATRSSVRSDPGSAQNSSIAASRIRSWVACRVAARAVWRYGRPVPLFM